MDGKMLKAVREGDMAHFMLLAQEHDRRQLLHGVTTPQGNSTLHLAVRFRQKELAEYLCRTSPSLLSIANASDDTPLHCAARTRQTWMVSFFVRQLQISSPPDPQSTMDVEEHGGVQVGDGRAAARMVLRMTNRDGNTALHEALRSGDGEAALELLKADPELSNIVNKNGESALFLAMLQCLWDVAHAILESPSFKHGGSRRWTALHVAVFRRRTDIARKLLEKRPELAKRGDEKRMTPLHYASLYCRVEMVRLLLEFDTSVAYALRDEGRSPVHDAAYAGDVQVIKELMLWCPDCLDVLETESGGSFLHIGVLQGKTNVVEFVMRTPELEYLINQPDNKGNTPLHLAAAKSNPKVVRLLLADKRVYRLARNREGESAFDTFLRHVEPTATLEWNETLLLFTRAFPSAAMYEKGVDKLTKEATEKIKSLTRAYTQNTTICAILIATITFTAAFTVPGGYKNDTGRDQGMPVLLRKSAFKAFLVSNAMAMCSSLIVSFLSIYATWEDVDYLLHYRTSTRGLMWFAFAMMVVAFATGTYTIVVPDCMWLAIFICALCGSIPFLTYCLVNWPLYALRVRVRRWFIPTMMDGLVLRRGFNV